MSPAGLVLAWISAKKGEDLPGGMFVRWSSLLAPPTLALFAPNAPAPPGTPVPQGQSVSRDKQAVRSLTPSEQAASTPDMREMGIADLQLENIRQVIHKGHSNWL